MEPTAVTQFAALPRNGMPSKRDLKLQQWESYRAEIHLTYIERNHTLEQTMDMLKAKYQFTPSVRKFKDKMKEWKFVKYLSAEESRFIATKAQARGGEGKGTTFFKNGMVIDQRRIEKSAKRKREEFEEMQSSAVATPQQITYETPHPHQDFDTDESDLIQPELHTRNHKLDASKPLDHDVVMREEENFSDFSRTHRYEFPLPNALAQSFDIIQDNDQSSGSALSAFSHTKDENTEASATNERPSNIQPEITMEQGSSLSLLEVEKPLSKGGTRKYGSRFFVHFGPPQDSEALAKGINELRGKLRRLERSDGMSSRTLEVALHVAKMLEESPKVESTAHADRLYRRVILGSDAIGIVESEQTQDAQFSLGSLLCRSHQYREAEIWLLAAASGCTRLNLSHLEISALGLLLEVYIQLNETRKMHDVMEMMWILLKGQIEGAGGASYWKSLLLKKGARCPITDGKSFLLESIRLVRAYHTQGDMQPIGKARAHHLLGSFIPYFEGLDDEKYGIDKLEGYLEYGCSCQRTDHWEEALKCFLLARQLLKRATQYDVDAMQFVEARLDEVSNELKGCYETPWDEQILLKLQVIPPITPSLFIEEPEVLRLLGRSSNTPDLFMNGPTRVIWPYMSAWKKKAFLNQQQTEGGVL